MALCPGLPAAVGGRYGVVSNEWDLVFATDHGRRLCVNCGIVRLVANVAVLVIFRLSGFPASPREAPMRRASLGMETNNN